jgi:hypothetical protein
LEFNIPAHDGRLGAGGDISPGQFRAYGPRPEDRAASPFDVGQEFVRELEIRRISASDRPQKGDGGRGLKEKIGSSLSESGWEAVGKGVRGFFEDPARPQRIPEEGLLSAERIESHRSFSGLELRPPFGSAEPGFEAREGFFGQEIEGSLADPVDAGAGELLFRRDHPSEIAGGAEPIDEVRQDRFELPGSIRAEDEKQSTAEGRIAEEAFGEPKRGIVASDERVHVRINLEASHEGDRSCRDEEGQQADPARMAQEPGHGPLVNPRKDTLGLGFPRRAGHEWLRILTGKAKRRSRSILSGSPIRVLKSRKEIELLPDFEVLERIRSQPQLKILVVFILSSSPLQSKLDRVLEMGGDCFTTKRVGQDRLDRIALSMATRCGLIDQIHRKR